MRRDSQGSGNAPGLKKSANGAASNAPKTSDRKTSTRSKFNPFYNVVRLFQQLFGAYDEVDQNTTNKRAALDMAISLKKSYYPDRRRFWQELLDEANVMLDSRRFHESCLKLGLDPQAVAEHLVVEGKAKWLKVLKEGLENYGEKVMMFRERLYVDKYNLYAKSETKDA
jgi:recombinational DNA repair ATPase RecF